MSKKPDDTPDKLPDTDTTNYWACACLKRDLLAARECIDLGAAVVEKWNEVSDRVCHNIHL